MQKTTKALEDWANERDILHHANADKQLLKVVE